MKNLAKNYSFEQEKEYEKGKYDDFIDSNLFKKKSKKNTISKKKTKKSY